MFAPGVTSATVPDATQATVAVILLPDASVTDALYVAWLPSVSDVGPVSMLTSPIDASTVTGTAPCNDPNVTVTVASPGLTPTAVICGPTFEAKLRIAESLVAHVAPERSTPALGTTVSVTTSPTSGDAESAVMTRAAEMTSNVGVCSGHPERPSKSTAASAPPNVRVASLAKACFMRLVRITVER